MGFLGLELEILYVGKVVLPRLARLVIRIAQKSDASFRKTSLQITFSVNTDIQRSSRAVIIQ